MMLKTGIKSNTDELDARAGLLAPLPNFGLLVVFKLTKWLYLDGTVGFFSLHTKTLGGAIHNYDVSLIFKPVRWLGFNVSYKEFDVNIFFPSEGINTTIDYNFRGPSLGISLYF